MKKQKPIIRLLLLILPVLIQFSSFAQGVIKAESGAYIVSQTGSYWVLDNGGFSLTSPTATTPVTIANLKIEAAASLTIPPLNYLTVTGTLTNSAGNSGLVLNSDATGTGSLINYTAAVPATVKRYITGASQAWHFLSSPLEVQAIQPEFVPVQLPVPTTTEDFFAWYEPEGTWVNFKNTSTAPTWNTANGNTNFTAGKGYLVEYLATNPTKKFTGNLNVGTVSPALSKSGTGIYAAYNLVGNPYPSTIDWKAASGWIRNALVSSGGGYDMSIWNDVDGEYGSFNSAGLSGSGTHGVTQFIPIGQGFMVTAKMTKSGSFQPMPIRFFSMNDGEIGRAHV